MNIAHALREHAAKSPDKVLLLYEGKTMTYAGFLDQVNRLANGLDSLGIRKDDKVGLLMTNRVEYLVSYYAIATIGAVAVPLNHAFTAYELAYHLNDSDAVAIVSEPVLLANVRKAQPNVPKLKSILSTSDQDELNVPTLVRNHSPERPLTARKPEDVMHLIYTSGTTGLPKGAMITHGNIGWMVNALNRFYGEKPEDLFIAALPLFHAYGKLQTFLAAINMGASIIVIQRFGAVEVMEAIAQYRATVFFGVPTMYTMMVNTPGMERYNLKTLRICVSGGASLPVEILRQFEEKTGVEIAEGYGLSEVTVMTHCCPVDGVKKAGSIGPVLPGLEAAVFNSDDEAVPVGTVGELVVRGPSIMKGYYKKEEESAVALRKGWFHTGDLVKADEDGYYYVVDRIKDMYIRGGRNVYPREIEEVLYTYPKVREAAVIGLPNEVYGEIGRAFIVLKEGQKADEEEVMAFLRERLARYKLPDSVHFIEALPKNSVGKILKRELKESIGKQGSDVTAKTDAN